MTVIGASAGGIAALRELVAALPLSYPAAVFVVVHLSPESPMVLGTLLQRISTLPVQVARSGDAIRPGTITLAPPDHHLIVEADQVLLSHGPRENRHRPSIDVLFRSAALAFGPRVTGVVLSGLLDDGSAGLWAVKQRGGAAVVQHPSDAEYPDMPRNAMDVVDVDAAVPMREMVATLERLAATGPAPAAGSEEVRASMTVESRFATRNDHGMEDLDRIGERVPYSCPECGGALWEVKNGGSRFRCHNGHAYSMRTLNAEQAIQVEAALWDALRRLEEGERVARRMASDAKARGNERSAEYHEDLARSSATHADVLRNLLAENSRRTTAPGDGGGEI